MLQISFLFYVNGPLDYECSGYNLYYVYITLIISALVEESHDA